MRYFVSYRVMKDGGFGYGREFVTTNGPITDTDDILAIEEQLEVEKGLTAALILYFKRIPEEASSPFNERTL